MPDNASENNLSGSNGANRSWFRAHYLGTPIPTYLWKCQDDDFILLDFNRAADDITNGKISHFLGMRAKEFYADQPRILDDLKRCSNERLVVQREMPYKFKTTNELKTLSVVYTHLEPNLIIVHTEDITEFKRAEAALRESEEKYRTLVEMSPQIIAIFQDHKVAFANPAAARLLGLDMAEDMIGLDVMAPVPPEDTKRLEDYLEKHLRDTAAASDNFTLKGRRMDGSPFSAEIFITGISYKGRPAVQLMGIDITEREKNQEALRESEEKYRTLVEVFPQAIVIFQDEKAVFANNASATMFGFERPGKYSGYGIFDRVPPDEMERLKEYYLRRMRGDADVPTRYITKLMRINGEVFPVELFVTRITYLGRPAVQIVAIDITERRKAEIAIRESEERFRAIWEHSPVGICLTDRHGVYHYVNKAYCDIYGYTEAELIGRPFFDLIMLPGHPRADRKNYGGYFDNPENRPLSETDIFVRKGGGTVVIQYSSDFIRQPDGAQYMVTMNVDVTHRKLAEKALRESETKYRLLVENQTDLVVKVDLEGRFLFVSPSYCKMFGKQESELLGRAFMPLVHEEDREPTAKAMGALFEPPHSAYIEQRAMTKNGWRWLAWVDTAMLDEKGDVKEIIGVGRDITERKKAEEALRESEEKYRTLVEMSPQAIAIFQDGRLAFGNGATARILGYEKIEDAIGIDIFELVPPEELERLKDYQARRARGEAGVPDRYLTMLRRKGGELFPAEVFATQVLYRGRLATQLVAIDNSEKQIAEQALRASEENYRLLFDNAVEAITAFDYDGRIVMINRAAATYLGGPSEDFIGMTLMDVFPQRQAEKFLESIRMVITTGQAFSSEVLVYLPGEPRWFRNNLQPVIGHDDRVKHTLLMATDIHHEKQIRIRNEARYNLLERLRGTKDINSCLGFCCQAIADAQLFRRAVLTLHNKDREITHLGQVGLDEATVLAASRAPAPGPDLARQMTQDNFRVSHSYFIPIESGVFSGPVDRHIPQALAQAPGSYPWRAGDELFVPLLGDEGRRDGWLSVDTPLDGMRPSTETVNYLEELIDITAKQVREIQSLESLQEKNIALKQVLANIREDKEDYRQGIRDVVEQVIIPALDHLVNRDGTINKTSLNIIRSGLPELAMTDENELDVFPKLSPREREICILIRNGLSTKQIAEELHISLYTAKKHREAIRRKLGINHTGTDIATALRGKRIGLASYLME